MKKSFSSLAVLVLITFQSCQFFTSEKEHFEDLIYPGKGFNKDLLGDTEIINTTEVSEFVKYRKGILNMDLIPNYESSIATMTVSELNKLADSTKEKEKVVFIFGLDQSKNLRCGIVSSLGYPKDNSSIYSKGGKWLYNKFDSTNYINYRKERVNKNIEPYMNFEKHPFVSFSKSSLKKVIKKLIKDKKWEDKTPLFFHYGYSKNKAGKYHVAILFTPLKDLSNTMTGDVGFANRGGTCCPPEN